MSNFNRKETLKDRLAKRRQVRDKTFSHIKSADVSEKTSTNHSPETTRSLDRKPSKRVSLILSATSVDQRKSSPTKLQDLEPLFTNTIKSNPSLEQVSNNQSSESENEKEVLSNSLPTKELQDHPHHDAKPVIVKKVTSPVLSLVISPTTTEKSTSVQQETIHPPHDVKPVIIKKVTSPILSPVISPNTTEKSTSVQQETIHPHHAEEPVVDKEIISPKLPPIIPRQSIKTSTPIQQEIDETSHSYDDEKPVFIEERASQKLPPIIPLRMSGKPNPIQLITHESPVPNQIKDLSQKSLDHPSSYPQSNINDEQKQFKFPSFYPKHIARSTSEQIVSTTKYKQPPFAKPESLALSYVFNKRMIDAEISRASSLDSDKSNQKTVWD